jgi:hypothetical protein
MAQNRKGSLLAIQAGLGIVIVILTYFLYDSITTPWEAIEREQELTESTRARMNEVRVALRYFEETNDRFPPSLDSLPIFVAADSILQVNPDSVFGRPFDRANFMMSARGGGRFHYALNDTGRVKIYFLKDPDSDDFIGSVEPDITALHAASWE